MSTADRAALTGRSLMIRGLVLLVVHLLIISSLGAKLLYDRATRPRVWVESGPFDPSLPIRGRYVSLTLRVDTSNLPPAEDKENPWSNRGVQLEIENDHLVARPYPGEFWQAPARLRMGAAGPRGTLDEPVVFFIPEHVADPSRRAEGETLWVEVTLPRKGPPRPICLGVRRGDGLIEPLALD